MCSTGLLTGFQVALSAFSSSGRHLKDSCEKKCCSGVIWPEMHKDLFWLIEKIFVLMPNHLLCDL